MQLLPQVATKEGSSTSLVDRRLGHSLFIVLTGWLIFPQLLSTDTACVLFYVLCLVAAGTVQFVLDQRPRDLFPGSQNLKIQFGVKQHLAHTQYAKARLLHSHMYIQKCYALFQIGVLKSKVIQSQYMPLDPAMNPSIRAFSGLVTLFAVLNISCAAYICSLCNRYNKYEFQWGKHYINTVPFGKETRKTIR